MLITDLQRVVLLLQTYHHQKPYPDEKTIQDDLGWYDLSLKQISRLVDATDYWNFDDYKKRRKLARELQLLNYFNNHYSKTLYMPMETIINDLGWNEYGNEVSTRQVKRYINDLIYNGFVILSKRGRYLGGFKLENKINL